LGYSQKIPAAGRGFCMLEGDVNRSFRHLRSGVFCRGSERGEHCKHL
jgi:hypothetical protein